MTKDGRAHRLKEARQKAGYTTQDAADRLGYDISVLRAHERGETQGTGRGFNADQAEDYARAYRVPPEWLLYGRNAPKWAWIKVISYVGAGAQIIPLDEPLEEIEPPPGDVSNDAFALIVRGESMAPAMGDGDILICEWRDDPSQYLGKTVVADLEDGRRLVKKLARGPVLKTFTLIGHDASMIEGVRLTRVAEILWHKLN